MAAISQYQLKAAGEIVSLESGIMRRNRESVSWRKLNGKYVLSSNGVM
jgi:hypothetical protein